MKKILLFTVAFIFSAALFAQKQSTNIKSSQLPQETQNYIKNNLPGCQITKATKVIEGGKVSYDVVVDVKGKKNLFVFDGIGTFVKRGDPIPQADPNKPPAATGSEQKIIPAEQQKTVQQTGEKDVKTVEGRKVAQPESQPRGNATQTTTPQGVKAPTDNKVAQPTGAGGTKQVAQPTGSGGTKQVTQPTGSGGTKQVAKPTGSGGTKPAAQPSATGGGAKPASQTTPVQPGTAGGVKPASSGTVQQTGSKNVQQTGTPDKKVAQPTGASGDITKPKK
jgi:hypothetical protein